MDIQITQDIRKYKTKDIGNFSLKECAFIAVAAGVGFVCYKYLNMGKVAAIPAGIVLIFGFFKPLGMSFFQFLRTVIKEELFTPREYINETDFEYDPDEFEELFDEKVSIPSGWNEPDAGLEYKHTKADLKEMIR